MFPCEVCSIVCVNKYNLKRHVAKIHPNSLASMFTPSQPKTHKCAICNKNCMHKSSLKVHIDNIHKKKTHVAFMGAAILKMKDERKDEPGTVQILY